MSQEECSLVCLRGTQTEKLITELFGRFVDSFFSLTGGTINERDAELRTLKTSFVPFDSR